MSLKVAITIGVNVNQVPGREKMQSLNRKFSKYSPSIKDAMVVLAYLRPYKSKDTILVKSVLNACIEH